MTDRYAVIGHPVGHSLSPEIHAAFARAAGQDMSYGRLDAPPGGFRDAVERFRNEGGCGLNVTLPFKHEAWAYVDEPAGGAAEARAVNTIVFLQRRSVGYNTDGYGLVADVERNLGFEIRARRVLLLGAGGASYGVAHPLLRARPAALAVANRTPEKAEALVRHLGGAAAIAPQGVAALSYAGLARREFDLVVNATSAGLTGELPPVPQSVFAPGALAYDMVYGRVTPFMTFAARSGARVADGLGMLVEQAAESFRIWRGARPDTAPVIEMLRRRGP